MARRYYSSIAARTTLSSSITSTAVTMGVVAVSGWPSSFPYTLIIDSDLATEEVVTVTGRSGLTVTIVRGVDGTTGQEAQCSMVFRRETLTSRTLTTTQRLIT